MRALAAFDKVRVYGRGGRRPIGGVRGNNLFL
jgi:hypothetical protein